MIPNAMTTLPIPFALNVDNPEDCPGELKLNAETGDKDDPMSFFTHGDFHLIGGKSVHFDEFERIPVHSQSRSY